MGGSIKPRIAPPAANRLWPPDPGRLAVAACILAAAALLLFTSPTGGDFWWADAPRHAMDGVFVHDLVHAHPATGLKAWAIAYYFRHPALTILFYPPLFAAVEAGFFLLFGVSHFCAQAVVAAFTALLAFSAYALARNMMPCLAALGCALLVIGVPETALWGRQVMLDIPAYALATAAAACLLLYLRAPTPQPLAVYGAALLLLAGIYTKYNTAFVLPPMALAAMMARSPRPWRDRHLVRAAAVFAVGLLPAVALFLAFGRLNLQSVTGISAVSPAGAPAAWLYYLWALPGQMGWVPLLVAIPGVGMLAGASVRQRDWTAAMLLGWLICGYAVFSCIALKQPRFDLALGLPLCVAACLALCGLRPPRLGPSLCVALGGVVLLHSVVFDRVPRVDGYRALALWLGHEAPANAVIVFSGYRDGNLIFGLIADAHRPDIAVVRADKLLLSVPAGERTTRGVVEHTVTEAQIAAVLHDIAPDFVVVQPGFWGDLHDMALFEQAVTAPAYRPTAHFELSGELSSQDGTQGLVVYAPTGPQSPVHRGLSFDMPMMGGRIQGEVR
jgi:hypothetical protein